MRRLPLGHNASEKSWTRQDARSVSASPNSGVRGRSGSISCGSMDRELEVFNGRSAMSAARIDVDPDESLCGIEMWRPVQSTRRAGLVAYTHPPCAGPPACNAT